MHAAAVCRATSNISLHHSALPRPLCTHAAHVPTVTHSPAPSPPLSPPHIQRASELASGAAPRAGLGLQPPLLTLRAHRGVATPLSVGVSSNPRAAALEAVPSVAAGAGHVPLALVGPEIQQEAQR